MPVVDTQDTVDSYTPWDRQNQVGQRFISIPENKNSTGGISCSMGTFPPLNKEVRKHADH